eukprot:6371711-Prymnesium_polylepis.1
MRPHSGSRCVRSAPTRPRWAAIRAAARRCRRRSVPRSRRLNVGRVATRPSLLAPAAAPSRARARMRAQAACRYAAHRSS